jgi:hypothetical protein
MALIDQAKLDQALGIHTAHHAGVADSVGNNAFGNILRIGLNDGEMGALTTSMQAQTTASQEHSRAIVVTHENSEKAAKAELNALRALSTLQKAKTNQRIDNILDAQDNKQVDAWENVEGRLEKKRGPPISNQQQHANFEKKLRSMQQARARGAAPRGAAPAAAPAAGQPLPPQLPNEVFRSTFLKRTTKDDNDNDVIDLTHIKSNFGCAATG